MYIFQPMLQPLQGVIVLATGRRDPCEFEVISFNASISACEKSADWQQALKFFDDFWSAKVGYTLWNLFFTQLTS